MKHNQKALWAMTLITLNQAMLWSLAFFHGQDGTIIAAMGGMAILISGLGGFVAVKRNAGG